VPVLVRTPQSLNSKANLQILPGDPLRVQDLSDLLAGHDAVIWGSAS
jgi:hypothetical protein